MVFSCYMPRCLELISNHGMFNWFCFTLPTHSETEMLLVNSFIQDYNMLKVLMGKTPMSILTAFHICIIFYQRRLGHDFQ